MVKKDTIEDNVTDADLKKTMNQSDRWQVVENIDQRLIIWVWLPMQLRRLTDIWKLILSMTCPVIGWTFKLKVFNETIKELKEHEYINVCNVTSKIHECNHCEYKLLLAMLIQTHIKEYHAERKGYNMWPVRV